MPSLSEDLVTFLAPNQVAQNDVSPRISGAYIWFRKASERSDTLLGGSGRGPVETHFDLEVTASNPDAAEDLADTVRGLLDLHTGAFGSTTVQAVFVEDHNDEYEPAQTGRGKHIVALDVLVIK